MRIKKINYKEALRYLGYNGQDIDGELKKQIEKCGEKVLEAASPKFIYKILENEVVFAATLGINVDKLILKYQLNDMADAAIADACASALIEQVMDEAEEEARSLIEDQGKKLGKRFSPGYGDFPLSASKEILQMLNAENSIGLTVDKGGLLSPIKSVTAIAKVMEKENQDDYTYGCGSCNIKETCSFRKGSR